MVESEQERNEVEPVKRSNQPLYF